MSKKTKEQDIKEPQNEQAVPEMEQKEQENKKSGTGSQSADSQGDMDFASLDEAIEVIARLQQELKETQTALEKEREQVLRLNADFVNFRNRQKKELSETVRFANQDLLVQLLPVLDDFDRTLKAIEGTDNLSAVKEGINLVSNNLRKRFSRIGLEPIESVGQEFDSEIHEAITTIPVEDEAQKGKVVDEVEKGYKLKEKVIRYSKVVVGE